MCNVDWVILLEYFKVFLSWPPLMATSFLLFILFYKEEIRNFIKNIKTVNVPGLGQLERQEAVTIEATVAEAEQVEKVEEFDEENISKDLRDPEIAKKEIEKYSVLKDDPIAEIELNMAMDDPVKYIARHRELLNDIYYERCHARIYGTQLQLIKQLVQSPGGARKIELIHHFETHLTLIGQSPTPDFNSYTEFLISSGLIENNPLIEINSLYKITSRGFAFYLYVQTHYPIGVFYKPF